MCQGPCLLDTCLFDGEKEHWGENLLCVGTWIWADRGVKGRKPGTSSPDRPCSRGLSPPQAFFMHVWVGPSAGLWSRGNKGKFLRFEVFWNVALVAETGQSAGAQAGFPLSTDSWRQLWETGRAGLSNTPRAAACLSVAFDLFILPGSSF